MRKQDRKIIIVSYKSTKIPDTCVQCASFQVLNSKLGISFKNDKTYNLNQQMYYLIMIESLRFCVIILYCKYLNLFSKHLYNLYRSENESYKNIITNKNN